MTAPEIGEILDKGVIAGLFVISFLALLYKGIPFLFKFVSDFIEKINIEHTHQIRILTETFEKTCKNMTDTFIEQQMRFNEAQEKRTERQIQAYQENCRKIEEFSKTLKQ